MFELDTVVTIEKLPGKDVTVKLSDVVLLIRTGASVLRQGGCPVSAEIYDEVASQLEVIGSQIRGDK